MALLVTGIHDDMKLQRMFLERHVMPRREMQRRFIREAIASGELQRGTDPELLIDHSAWAAVLSLAAGARSFREELCRTYL